MKSLFIALPVEIIATTLFFLQATSAAYTDIVVFGASYCDNGSNNLTNPPYYGGRWTNGLTFSEYLSEEIGARLNDYAVGGAVVENFGGSTQSAHTTHQQVQTYLAALESRTIAYNASSQVLHMWWVGLNTIKEIIWPELLSSRMSENDVLHAMSLASSNAKGVLSQATAIQNAFKKHSAASRMLILSIPPTQTLPQVTGGSNAAPEKLAYLDQLTRHYNDGLYNGVSWNIA